MTVWVKEDEDKSNKISVLIGKKLKDDVEQENTKKAESEKTGTEAKDKEKTGEELKADAKEEAEKAEDAAMKKKLVVVKNARLDYLFKVDAGFLDQIPKKLEDWKKTAEIDT